MGTRLNMKLSSLLLIYKLIVVFNVFLMVVFVGCARKSDKNLIHAQNYYRLCMVELADGDSSDASLRKALGHLERAIELDINPEYLATKATIFFRFGKLNKSLKLFEQSLILAKKDFLRGEILNNLACVYAKMGKRSKAAIIWHKLVKAPYYLTPEVALVNLAKLHVQESRYKKARDYFYKAVKEAPTYIDAHFYLAVVSYKMGDFGCARREISTTLFMDPLHHGARELERHLVKNNGKPTRIDVLL